MRREIAVLRAQNALLESENATLRAQVAKLVATVAKLNERVGELLAIAQRKQRARTTPSEKKPEPPPVLGADAQKAFDERPKPPELPEKTKRTKVRLAAWAGTRSHRTSRARITASARTSASTVEARTCPART